MYHPFLVLMRNGRVSVVTSVLILGSEPSPSASPLHSTIQELSLPILRFGGGGFPILVIPQLMESLLDHYSHDQRADILLSVPIYTYYPHITAEAALVANDLNSGTSFSNLKPNGMGLSISPD